MKRLLPVLLGLLLTGSAAQANELVYQGDWKTTNRKLDGTMTCVVTRSAPDAWQGRFFGTWQGVDFDYTVSFTGPPNDLRGTATIDGAAYEWRAWINRDRLRANFGGERYTGSFDLQRERSGAVAKSMQSGSATSVATNPHAKNTPSATRRPNIAVLPNPGKQSPQ